ncbi:MAG: GNAT family N-acetyltransferase [Lachnospiraceae bacterium]|nr:GNAT family N-acetyltransferase [Lachnospiraceae bacterium]
MEITGIGKNNLDFFKPIIFGDSTKKPERLMVGVIQEGYPIAAGVMESSKGIGIITSIFTLPEFRKKGAAGMILDAFFRVASHSGLERIEIDYTSNYKSMSDFLIAEGFNVFPGEKLYRVSCKKIITSPKATVFFKKTKMGKTFCMEDIGSIQQHEVEKYLESKDLSELRDRCENKMIFVSYDPAKKIEGVMLCFNYDKETRVELMLAEGKSPIVPLKLIQILIFKMKEYGLVDNNISFLAMNPHVMHLFTSVFGEDGLFLEGEQGIYAFKSV